MKKNLFDVFDAIISNPNYVAPIDFFGDLEGSKMTTMVNRETGYAGLFDVIKCTHDYSFIEEYSSRAAKEWEALGTCSKNIEDRYLGFASLSCGVNDAIDAAKKNPKAGIIHFKKFTDGLKIASDYAKRSGKLDRDGKTYIPLLAEQELPDDIMTNPRSAMGQLKKVLDKSVPAEFGLYVSKRPEGAEDSYVDAHDATKADELEWNRIAYDNLNEKLVRYIPYEAYKGLVSEFKERVCGHDRVVRAFEKELDELNHFSEINISKGVNIRWIIRFMTTLFIAANKDFATGRPICFKFGVLALKLMNDLPDEYLEAVLCNEAVVYLKSASDKWLDWYGNKYHAVTNMLFNIEALIALFGGEWTKIANVQEEELTEEDIALLTGKPQEETQEEEPEFDYGDISSWC